jgi:hypothetical protein
LAPGGERADGLAELKRYSREIPTVWTLPPEGLPILYANQLISQIDNGGFILSFGQAQPPVIVGTPEEQKAQAEAVESVERRTVARIGLTRNVLELMIKALNENLAAFDAVHGVSNHGP